MSEAFRAYKVRLCPTREQVAALTAWSDSCRALWNAALEARKWRLQHRAPWVTATDQCKELTAARAAFPWMAAVPTRVQQETLRILDRAWADAYGKRRVAGRREPRFKSKRDGLMTLRFDRRDIKFSAGRVRLPLIGEVTCRGLGRHSLGEVRNVTIGLDVDRWQMTIAYKVTVPEMALREGPVVALDRGVTWAVADSDGQLIENPRFLARAEKSLRRAQRAASKKRRRGKPATANCKRALLRVAKVHRRVRLQREHWTHHLSSQYAKSHGVVVVEDLKIANMTKSARGTAENPGKSVRAKSGLNRAILDSGWGQLIAKLEYKTAALGGTVVKVPPAYSSQTCSHCGHVSPDSRRREAFRCVACGHEDHADVNAAKVLLSRRPDGKKRVEATAAAMPSPACEARTAHTDEHREAA